MTVRGIVAASLAVTAMAAPAGAAGVDISAMTPGYTYFNRPGADAITHDADVRDCAMQAITVQSVADNYLATYGSGDEPWRGLAFDVVWGSRLSKAHRAKAAAALESCMVVRGWRVVKLEATEGRALAALTPEGIALWLAPWIGAQAPHGEIVRLWGNDAARVTTRRFNELPSVTDGGQLSLTAATASDVQQFTNAPPREPLTPGTFIPPGTAEALANPPAGFGVLVVGLRGVSNRDGFDLLFAPDSPDGAPAASPAVKTVRVVLDRKTMKVGDVQAFVVPAGRWRFAGIIGKGAQVLSFCWGAPFFEITAGEGVWAGDFDLASSFISPDLSLEKARAKFGDSIPLLKPAQYANGSTSQCYGSIYYAFELEGLPFAPNYGWGSAGHAKGTP